MTHAKRLGILKAKRLKHRQRDDWAETVWGSPISVLSALS
jgi:hypothetical protein